jgi:hypothetical protein
MLHLLSNNGSNRVASAALVALIAFFEERCLRHRELDGHATPKWVLQSAARQRLCTPPLSEVSGFAAIPQRSSLTA